MGTLANVANQAINKVNDPSVRFRDTQVLEIINDLLETIYQTLVNINSNLVYAIGDITTSDGVAEYTPSFAFDGFLREGSWVDGEDTYLRQVSEADKIKWDFDSSTSQPEAFYLEETGKIGYLWTPNDTYTIHHTYWKPLISLTSYDSDDLPWGGIFNRYIGKQLAVELLETTNNPERDNKIMRFLALADIEWNKAMNMVYIRGVRREKIVSNFFSVGGV